MSGTQIHRLLTEAQDRLRSLTPERLRVANDFLAYLQEREENEATEELLAIPGFEEAFQHAVAQADSGDTVRFEDIHRDGRGPAGSGSGMVEERAHRTDECMHS